MITIVKFILNFGMPHQIGELFTPGRNMVLGSYTDSSKNNPFVKGLTKFQTNIQLLIIAKYAIINLYKKVLSNFQSAAGSFLKYYTK